MTSSHTHALQIDEHRTCTPSQTHSQPHAAHTHTKKHASKMSLNQTHVQTHVLRAHACNRTNTEKTGDTYTETCTRTCISVCVHIHIHIYIYTHINIYIYISIYIYIPAIHTSMPTSTCVQAAHTKPCVQYIVPLPRESLTTAAKVFIRFLPDRTTKC